MVFKAHVMTTLVKQKELIGAYVVPANGTTLNELCKAINYNHAQAYSIIIPIIDGIALWGDFEPFKQQNGAARSLNTYRLSKDQVEVVVDSIERVVDFKIKRMEARIRMLQ